MGPSDNEKTDHSPSLERAPDRHESRIDQPSTQEVRTPDSAASASLLEALKHLRLISFAILSVAAVLAYFAAHSWGSTGEKRDREGTISTLRQLNDHRRALRMDSEASVKAILGQDESAAGALPVRPREERELKELGLEQLTVAEAIAELRKGGEIDGVEILGNQVRGSAVAWVGPLVLILLLSYLLIHIRHLRAWSAVNKVRLEAPTPWVGTMRDRWSTALTAFVLCLLPVLAVYLVGLSTGQSFLAALLATGPIALLGSTCVASSAQLADSIRDK